MICLGAFAICFILVIALNSADVSAKAIDLNVNVAVVHNLTTFLSENPDVKVLIPLIKEQLSDGASPKPQINYRIGYRINGDRVIATANGGNQWPSPQDVKLTLTYPSSGVGNVVTFIHILVEQSTNLGRGYVSSGGIGQRQITVIIEAENTLYFKYATEMYGY